MKIQEPNPNSSSNPLVQYLWTLPARIVIACFLLMLSSIIVLNLNFNYRKAKVVKAHGEEITVFVQQKVLPSSGRDRKSRQYYILKSRNRGAFRHYTKEKYPVGESISMLYLSSSNPHSSFAAHESDILIRGKKSDSLIALYFSSIRKNKDDYGFTHTLCSFIFAILAIKVVLPPSNKNK
ncbi:hypothetical protein VB620_08030 [Nodularia harveyana UHCC-0300]|uniref:Uncharacterized protein n=1 Tax=Nodularia harveyana UHCC-0300 TaxID=2974287 RepID=A0ABU5UCQ1_9CYAN|nr:hypothetical protein [Nodularia harveyana]MEA5581287.1 hypothetical protein [Nodularia harveyana UHCC-0300]